MSLQEDIINKINEGLKGSGKECIQFHMSVSKDRDTYDKVQFDDKFVDDIVNQPRETRQMFIDGSESEVEEKSVIDIMKGL